MHLGYFLIRVKGVPYIRAPGERYFVKLYSARGLNIMYDYTKAAGV